MYWQLVHVPALSSTGKRNEIVHLTADYTGSSYHLPDITRRASLLRRFDFRPQHPAVKEKQGSCMEPLLLFRNATVRGDMPPSASPPLH